jgi:hypothetical protein
MSDQHQICPNATKQKEEKYLVLKLADIENILTEEQKKNLNAICAEISLRRLYECKKRNHYIVVNEEEPYSEKVWDLVLGRSQ